MNPTIFDKYFDTIRRQDVIDGLLMAEAICGQVLIKNIDKNTVDVVTLIMDQISKTIEELAKYDRQCE